MGRAERREMGTCPGNCQPCRHPWIHRRAHTYLMENTPEQPAAEECLKRAERLAREAEHHVPSWLRPGAPESRLPVLFALVTAIVLQLGIARSFVLVPRWPLIA